ncbi:helix-turn-helix domain-containing protein [Rhizobium sp. CSW-27]|uniref:helix-turn-helix domain-containing protein n=1 Tax=Rhizobium sp. CSW-27 TaxID=2839985 RepID=UPI001C039AE3|nr:helix-turn-helix domain-containing protein [Rhizobium sp. CSW-27]
MLAAKRFEKAHKQPGRKSGPLGAVAIEVLEYMANLVDYRSGRLEPSIDTIMQKLCRSRDAVWKALTALRRHGFLDWVRRYVPTHNDSAGPQVQQTSNAYRLALPRQAEEALARDKPPLPEDRAQADLEKMTAEAEHELQRIGRDGLEWLAQTETFAGRRARMLLNLLPEPERESVIRTEPRTKHLL